MVGMMMANMSFVKYAIILGKKYFLLHFLVPMQNMTVAMQKMLVDSCTNCDTNKNRRLVNNYCICENGWFDPGTE